MATVKRREMEAWLQRNGFALEPGGHTSHKHFLGHGVKITVPGHGPQDMNPAVVSQVRRRLREVGMALTDFPGRCS